MAKGPDCKSEARESVREFESPPVLQLGDDICGVCLQLLDSWVC